MEYDRADIALGVERICEMYRNDELHSLIPLSFLLNVKGKPYTLKNHFMFEPMFELQRPTRLLWKCARQVGKSLNMTGDNMLTTFILPHYTTLFVCPRFEQVKRLSTDYVRPFVNDSYFRDLFIDTECTQAILQRNYRNRSTQYFSFAFLDTERIRGIPADQINVDEVQDINWEFIPVMEETLSGSEDYGIRRYTGTPKSFENTIEQLWQRSSMAEWCVRCSRCNTWNIPTIEQHLIQMIGKKSICCYKCKREIKNDVPNGQYVHKVASRRPNFPGYHISQVIHPYHYRKPSKWAELLYKMGVYGQAKFYNECLGESWDSALRLMTQTMLQQISQDKNPNVLEKAIKRCRGARLSALGIDWGGGGDESKSHTKIAVACVFPGSDVIECVYAEDLGNSLLPPQELRLILDRITQFNPRFIAHDYGGAGNLRESMLLQAGVPPEKIIPYTYVFSSTKHVIRYNQPAKGSRSSYSMDKPRSIVTLCTMMKAGKVLLPEWESSKDNTCDFLNIIEERQDRPKGHDIVLVNKVPETVDDFVHALNYACSSIWYSQQSYPNIAEAMHLKLSQEDINQITPVEPNWNS
jgi:hypothetical protein